MKRLVAGFIVIGLVDVARLEDPLLGLGPLLERLYSRGTPRMIYGMIGRHGRVCRRCEKGNPAVRWVSAKPWASTS